MQLNITGQHLELTEALQEYVSTKFERLERHVDNITNVQVVLKLEKERQIAEATLHVAGADLHATAEADDMYVVISSLNLQLHFLLPKVVHLVLVLVTILLCLP